MSNTIYKLICKYAGAFDLTIGKEYPHKGDPLFYFINDDNGKELWFLADPLNSLSPFHVTKYFDLVPVDATPDPIEPEVGQLWTCQVLDRPNLTMGKAYRITSGNSKELWIKSDNGSTSLYSKKDFINRFRFHSDPTEKAPDPIMVQPADYIDSKLLEAYKALDENGKAIMREKMPDVKWPKEVRYVTREEYSDYDHDVFGVEQSKLSDPITFNFPPDKYTPEINGGEIRFRVNE